MPKRDATLDILMAAFAMYALLAVGIIFGPFVKDLMGKCKQAKARTVAIEQIITEWDREDLFRGNDFNVKILTVNKKTLREFAGHAYDRDDVGLESIDLQNKEGISKGFPPGGILRSKNRQLEFWFQAGFPPSQLGGPFRSLPVFIMWMNEDKINFYTYSNVR